MCVPHDTTAALVLRWDIVNAQFRLDTHFKDRTDFLAYDDDFIKQKESPGHSLHAEICLLTSRFKTDHFKLFQSLWLWTHSVHRFCHFLNFLLKEELQPTNNTFFIYKFDQSLHQVPNLQNYTSHSSTASCLQVNKPGQSGFVESHL